MMHRHERTEVLLESVENCYILDEVLECVATWKEGSSRYLVGRIMSPSQLPSSKYQCFRYERHYDEKKGGIVVKMAQSYSGACEGLWSAEEGDRTYTFWTGNNYFLHKVKCCIYAVFTRVGPQGNVEAIAFIGSTIFAFKTNWQTCVVLYFKGGLVTPNIVIGAGSPRISKVGIREAMQTLDS